MVTIFYRTISPVSSTPPAAWSDRCAAAALALCFAAALTIQQAQAQTQTQTTLVSNTTETLSSSSSLVFQAQSFETGGHAAGYTVTNVQIHLNGDNSTLGTLIRIRENSSGNEPGNLVATLVNPTTLSSSNSLNTFTAPSGTVLAANTTYWITVSEGIGSSRAFFSRTAGDGQTGESGWSIGDDRLWRSAENEGWSSSSTVFVMAINGMRNTSTNNPATGAPVITGTATVGQTLTAGAGTIADDDNLPTTTFPSGYSFQWVLVDGTTETDIAGADERTFKLAGAELDEKVKVKVSFTDGAGNEEEVTSAAYPVSDGVANPAEPVEQYLDTSLLVSQIAALRGCSGTGSNSCGQLLADDDFTVGGTEFTITRLATDRGKDGLVDLRLTPALTQAQIDTWVLEADGLRLRFSEDDATETARFMWDRSGLSWSSGSNITVKIGGPATAATGAPDIAGTATVGQTLTAERGNIADFNGLPAFPADYDFQWVRVDADGGNPVDIPTPTSGPSSWPGRNWAGRSRSGVSFQDGDDNAEEVTSAAYPVSANVANPAAPTVQYLEAKLTAQARPGNWIGCYGSLGSAACSASMTEHEFTVGGTDFAVEGLRVTVPFGQSATPDHSVSVEFTVAPTQTQIDSWVIEIGDVRLRLSDADNVSSAGKAFDWNRAGLTWSDGDTNINIKIGGPRVDNAAPEFADDTQTRGIPENTAGGVNVGAPIPAATDDDGDPLTYSMAGADAASFVFDPETRQIATRDGLIYDFETKPVYTVTVRADDGTDVGVVTVTINLVDDDMEIVPIPLPGGSTLVSNFNVVPDSERDEILADGTLAHRDNAQAFTTGDGDPTGYTLTSAAFHGYLANPRGFVYTVQHLDRHVFRKTRHEAGRPGAPALPDRERRI